MSKQNAEREEAVTGEVISIEPAQSERAAPRSWPGVIAVFSLLIACAAATGAGWLWWQAQQTDYSEDQQWTSLTERVEQISRTVATADDLQVIIAQIQRETAERDQAMTEQRAAIDAVSDELQAIKGVRQDDWVLAEAEYLLRLANQSVLMGQQADSALAMLTAADDILRGRNNPRWYPVRQAIADDVAALEVAADFDLEGIYLKLATLITRTALLELSDRGIKEYRVSDSVAVGSLRTEPENWWDHVRATLDQYLLIRQRSEPVEPLLPASEDHLLRMNLMLLLEQAQAALMSAEPVIYRDELMRAQQLVRTYFDTAVSINATFNRQLSELIALDVKPPLPDIRGSLLAMREVLRKASSTDARVGEGTP